MTRYNSAGIHNFPEGNQISPLEIGQHPWLDLQHLLIHSAQIWHNIYSMHLQCCCHCVLKWISVENIRSCDNNYKVQSETYTAETHTWHHFSVKSIVAYCHPLFLFSNKKELFHLKALLKKSIFVLQVSAVTYNTQNLESEKQFVRAQLPINSYCSGTAPHATDQANTL